MTLNRSPLLNLLCVVTTLASVATGQNLSSNNSGAAAAAQSSSSAQVSGEPILQYGFDERFRVEHWNNVMDFSDAKDDEREQFRFRTRMWFRAPIGSSGAEFYVRVADEFKRQAVPDIKFNNDEVFFDNLYFNFKKTPIKGLSLQVGRQDIQRGEGFILSDGGAVDGSRSNYYNAVVTSYSWMKSKVEVVGILDPKRDRFLPIGHNQNKYLNEWDEQAVGLYYTGRESKQTDVDAYYFYKKEIHDYRAATNAQFQPDRHVSTLGARVVRRLPTELSLTGEFAAQWGAQHANPAVSLPSAVIRAWAGYGYAKKTINPKNKLYVLGGYRIMSGDDPATKDKIEGWDPLFGRYPKYSDLYAYSMSPEKGLGYWSNMGMWQAEAGITPWKPVNFRAVLYSSSALHPVTNGSTSVFSSGTHRGESFLLRSDWKLNEVISGHFQYENFFPGDFYANKARAHFFRAELMYGFKGTVGRLGK